MTLVVTQEPQLVYADETLEKGVFSALLRWQFQHQAGLLSGVENLGSFAAVPHINAGKLPVEGALLTTRLPFVTCRRVKAWQDFENPGTFYYEATFSDANASGTEPGTSTNPLLDRPKVEAHASKKSKAVHYDKDDKAILNAAGDPVITDVDYQTLTFSIRFNVGVDQYGQPLLPGYFESALNTVNIDTIRVHGYVLPPGVARFELASNVAGSMESRNGINYFVAGFELQADYRNEHKDVKLDAGFRERVNIDPLFGDTAIRRITEDDGSEPSEPVPLNQESSPPGARLVNPDPEDVYFLNVEHFPPVPYGGMKGVIRL